MQDHSRFFFFFFNDTATTEIYTLSLHDALPISAQEAANAAQDVAREALTKAHEAASQVTRSEEHTSELQSLRHLVCRLLLEKKKKTRTRLTTSGIATLPAYAPQFTSQL